MDSSGSTPASPASGTGEPGPRPAPAQLGDSNINSKSLPNIPSRWGHLVIENNINFNLPQPQSGDGQKVPPGHGHHCQQLRGGPQTDAAAQPSREISLVSDNGDDDDDDNNDGDDRYAILPLRKHLMQKSMMERRSMDDNQYTYLKVANSYNKNSKRILDPT